MLSFQGLFLFSPFFKSMCHKYQSFHCTLAAISTKQCCGQATAMLFNFLGFSSWDIKHTAYHGHEKHHTLFAGTLQGAADCVLLTHWESAFLSRLHIGIMTWEVGTGRKLDTKGWVGVNLRMTARVRERHRDET